MRSSEARALPAQARPGPPWPTDAHLGPGGELDVDGVGLAGLAGEFGTPLYVLSEGEVRARCRAYRQVLPEAEVAYAAKAFLCRTMLRWIEEEGLSLDVCSLGELQAAAAAHFPPERIILHGNAKSPEELRAAMRYGVGRIALDGLGEVHRLAALVPPGWIQRVLVRVTPGVTAGHHGAVRTGVEDQKFGLSLTGGGAEEAISRVIDQPRLRLAGLHCHLGSQITTVEPYLQAVDRLVGLMARIRDRHGIVLPELDLGGGHGVAYRPGEAGLDLAAFAAAVPARIAGRCAELNLPVPRLTVEPGRAIAGPAGVAVYRVLSVKRAIGSRTFVAVDGGMSDNPRPALYGARYTVRLIGRATGAANRVVTVVGRHCEAGDLIADGVELPADLRPGDLLAVPVAGAYQVSMASGYNMVGRPPVLAVGDGVARLLIRRETFADLSRRDVGG